MERKSLDNPALNEQSSIKSVGEKYAISIHLIGEKYAISIHLKGKNYDYQ